MKRSRFRSSSSCRRMVVFLLLLALPLGCAYHLEEGGKAVILASSEAFKNFSGEYENTRHFDRYKPKRIAVLPFQDLEQKLYPSDFDSDDCRVVIVF